MRAFSNTEVTKEEVLASLAEHRKADRLISGRYWENGRGCAIGCTIHDFRSGFENKHATYEPLFGIPRELAYLEDTIFEHLPSKVSQKWPERFMAAVPIGADLTFVAHRFVHWLLGGTDSPIAKWQDEPHIVTVRELYDRELAGDPPTQEEWEDTVKDLTKDATMNAAISAWSAATWATAKSTAIDVAIAAAWAANDAMNITTWSAHEVMADKLIEFIERASN